MVRVRVPPERLALPVDGSPETALGFRPRTVKRLYAKGESNCGRAAQNLPSFQRESLRMMSSCLKSGSDAPDPALFAGGVAGADSGGAQSYTPRIGVIAQRSNHQQTPWR